MLDGVWFRKPMFFVLDLCYMLTLTGCYSVFTYAFNNGMHRLFLAIPIVLGFVAYHNTIGRVVIYFSEAIIRFIRAVLHYLVVVPLSFLWRLISRAVMWILRHTVGLLLNLGKALGGLLYTKRQQKLLRQRIRL